MIETFKLVSKLTFVDLLRRLQRGWQPPMDAEVSTTESSAPGGATIPSMPGPAVSISAPAPEPEDALASAPVLAVAGESAAEEPEWVPPSAEGTFADLSDDSQKNVASAARAAAEAAAPAVPPLLVRAPSPAGASHSTSDERPRAVRAETTAPVTPLDDRLNAVLAEARRAAAGRISGAFKRTEDASTQELAKPDSRRLDGLEKALDAERDERRQLASALEAEKAARAAAGQKLEEALEALRSFRSGLDTRLADAVAALEARMAAARADAEATTAALKAEAEGTRRGLADAVATERAARESAEAAGREEAGALSARVASLREELLSAKGAAEASRTSAESAVERARRLEEALRAALRDLT